jgi:hypothetical protein
MTDALLAGRTVAALETVEAPIQTGLLFQDQRFEEKTIEGHTFRHCTFANVSFLKTSILRCTFEDCAFLECYFRNTTFEASTFGGCKFINSAFPKPTILTTRFHYCDFRQCFIPHRSIKDSLPDGLGYQSVLAQTLAREAEASGATSDARAFRLIYATAERRHQWSGMIGADAWYRQKFQGKERFDAGARWLAMTFNNFLWGHGDRGWVLFRNVLVLTALVFPLLYMSMAGSFEAPDQSFGWIDALLLSVDALLNFSGFSSVEPTSTLARTLVGTEVLLGLVVVGLSVTILFRWITRR